MDAKSWKLKAGTTEIIWEKFFVPNPISSTYYILILSERRKYNI